jgi:hypothetical protein
MRLVVGLIVCVLMFSPAVVFAGDGALAGRVTALEDALSQGFFQTVDISGLLEVEASYSSDYEDAKEGDVDLATLELGIDVALNDFASGFVLLKYENDDDDDVFLDEGGITIGNVEEYGFAVTAGKLYVPFGVYETAMISDPLTLELGETREGAVTVDFATGGFYGAAYAFNSEIGDDAEDDEIDAFGVTAGYAFAAEGMSVDVSAGWISNLTSSGGFSDYLDEEGVDILDDYTAGATVCAVVNVADFTLIGEYLTALDDDYLATEDSEPETWNLELGYGFDMSGHEASVAVAYQGSDEAAFLGLPETRLAAVFGYEITAGLGVSFEYIHDEDYDSDDGGTGDSADAVTCQLALEF